MKRRFFVGLVFVFSVFLLCTAGFVRFSAESAFAAPKYRYKVVCPKLEGRSMEGDANTIEMAINEQANAGWEFVQLSDNCFVSRK